jgi:hypothetical protein
MAAVVAELDKTRKQHVETIAQLQSDREKERKHTVKMSQAAQKGTCVGFAKKNRCEVHGVVHTLVTLAPTQTTLVFAASLVGAASAERKQQDAVVRIKAKNEK